MLENSTGSGTRVGSGFLDAEPGGKEVSVGESRANEAEPGPVS